MNAELEELGSELVGLIPLDAMLMAEHSSSNKGAPMEFRK